MARVKIMMPESFGFSTVIAVRITDVNYGGHAGNDAILGIIHEARMRYLAHLGYSELDVAGAGLIMADVAIEFKNEAYYGDPITASVAAADFSRVGFDLFYRLEIISGNLPVTVALAKTGMVCFDYSQKKICPLPQEVRQKLATD